MLIRFRFLLIILAPIIVGGGMFFMGLHVIYDDHRLNSTGKTAVVTGMVFKTEGNSDEIHFRNENGDEVGVRMVVPMDIRAKLSRHEPVSVDYLPNEPEVNRFTGQKRALYSLTAVGFAILLLGLYLLSRLISK